MTTVSVQPTTSEPNEREAFEKFKRDFQKKNDDGLTEFDIWQHNQKRIDAWVEKSIERDIPTMSQFVNERDCFLAREKWYQDRIESLQAQMNVAVEALKYYASVLRYAKAIDALAEIKKIGE